VRRLLWALTAAAVLASCGGNVPAPVAEVTPTASPTPTPTPTPVPTPEPEPEPILAPLTGLPIDDEDALERPVLAVKIDNHPKARPQVGLDQADIVVEELVEGGATRFIGLFHSEDPGAVGPVRSGRNVDADLLVAFQPVLAISGAAPPVYSVLRGAGLLIFEEGQAGGAFFRQSGRSSPHNLFATAERLWSASGDLPSAEPPWPFDEDVPDGGELAERVAFSFSPGASAAWTWDGDAWHRAQNGSSHLSDSGEPLDAANVVIAKVVVGSSGNVDSSGNRTASIQVTGEGDAVVLRDGYAYHVRWRKESAALQFEWLDAFGEPFPLTPGRTWIELVPVGAAVNVEHPGADDEADREG
jgi:hypothetical protein